MSDLKLKAGETYVFIDYDARRKYIESNECNKGLLEEYYKDGFELINIVGGDGCIGNYSAISPSETKYFKLKETKMKATDIVNVEMTALDACKLRDLMSGVGGGELSSFYGRLEGLFPSYSSLRGSYSWRNSSNFGKWALSQFEPEKTEHQIKIEKLRNTIDDAKAQIEALEG